MANYKYIDIIYKPDGKLRCWEEHDLLAKYEQYQSQAWVREEGKLKVNEQGALLIKVLENEKRS